MMKLFTNSPKEFLRSLEEKAHIVNKLVNLTAGQKQEVNDFFKTYRNLENQIDWNKGQKLTFEGDFKPLIDGVFERREAKSKVPLLPIEGVEEGKDYLRLKTRTSNPNLQAFMSLNHEGQMQIESPSTGGMLGDWCIGYKDDQWWNDYNGNQGLRFIVLIIPDDTKVCIQITSPNNTLAWDEFDKSHPIAWASDRLKIQPREMQELVNEGWSHREEIGEIRVRTYKEIETGIWASNNKEDVEVNVNFFLTETEMEYGDTNELSNGDDTTIGSFTLQVLDEASPAPDWLTDILIANEFNWTKGRGLLVTQTTENTPVEAYRSANRMWNESMRDNVYYDDAESEIKNYVGYSNRNEGYGRKRSNNFRPFGYVIWNNTDHYSQSLESDEYFYSLTSDFMPATDDELDIDGFHITMVTNFDYSFKKRDDWEGLNQQVPREWDPPEQQHFDFTERQRRQMMSILLNEYSSK